MTGSNDAYQRIQAHRSTLAGLGGIVLVAIAVLLTLAHVAGNVVPTVLGIAGVGALMAGVSTGAMQVMDNFRFRRDAPFYGPDDEDDE